jgi:hypothetical protein
MALNWNERGYSCVSHSDFHLPGYEQLPWEHLAIAVPQHALWPHRPQSRHAVFQFVTAAKRPMSMCTRTSPSSPPPSTSFLVQRFWNNCRCIRFQTASWRVRTKYGKCFKSLLNTWFISGTKQGTKIGVILDQLRHVRLLAPTHVFILPNVLLLDTEETVGEEFLY